MPIKPELRYLYGKEWRYVTRPRILARAGDKCEQCGKPHQKTVTVMSLSVGGRLVQFWRSSPRLWIRCSDRATFPAKPFERAYWKEGRAHDVFVLLTVAHLNHVSGDDRDENLKALCQWCHLNYDKLHHHETRATRKDASRPLLADAMAELQPQLEALDAMKSAYKKVFGGNHAG